jgi:hypothetical protein
MKVMVNKAEIADIHPTITGGCQDQIQTVMLVNILPTPRK